MGSDAQLVSHRSAHYQQRSWEACKLRDEPFEVACALAISEDIVAETCCFNGCKHGRGWPCGDVAC